MEETQPVVELQILQTPIKEETGLEMEPKSSSKLRVVSSRCTRSQVAPDWTVQEMVVLVSEIAAIDADFLKALPSIQKWKIIADKCTTLGIVRSSNQCHRKWESLLAEYKKIKDWESQSAVDSFWSLENERKMEFGLPVFFDRELYRSIGDLVKVQEDRSGTDPDSESEVEAEMLNVVMDSGSKKRRSLPGRKKIKIEEKEQEIFLEEKEQEMAVKLLENAELIHAILRGDLSKNTGNALDGLKNAGALQMEFTRLQGTELIEVLGSLVSTLDQLSDLVQECG